MDGARRIKRVNFVPLLFLLWVTSCTAIYTAHGVYYRVQPGDSLAGIAMKYHKELQELAEVNNIENTEEIKPGRSLYIPGVTPPAFARIIERERGHSHRVAKWRKKGARKRTESSTASVPAIEVDHGRFIWPVQGGLSSVFGMRHGRRHDGVDIRAKRGTPVIASADGEVVFSKRMRGYGNLVLLKHGGDFFTVYAHNSVNLVKKGKRVKKGETIAKVGRTGRATGPHLHFEVREGTKARNPLFFLPKKGRIEEVPEKEIADENEFEE